MKSRILVFATLSFLLLAAFTCSPLATTTPVALPPVETPTHAVPTRTPVLQTSTETPIPATEEATSTPPAALPAFTPQPAAPSELTPGSQVQLDKIHMVSQTEGWGISGRYLLVTMDGGQTWREVTPSAGKADMIYGEFYDRQTAWIVFSNEGQIETPLIIYVTNDGGLTWSTNQGPPIFPNVFARTWTEFAALDARNVWVMVRGVSVGAGTHYSHELFRTSDGGLTWTSLDGEISDAYTGMVFADALFGLRTLETVGFYEPGAPAYDVTTDGGVTWERRELPPPPDAPDLFTQYSYCESYQPVLLSNQSIHMLVGCFDYHFPPKQFTSYIYSSLDGGTTWASVKFPDEVLVIYDTLLYFDTNNALLLGKQMFQSADSGQTWTFVQTVSWDGQFSFIDPQHGWAVVWGEDLMALVKTINGGVTWTKIKPTIAK